MSVGEHGDAVINFMDTIIWTLFYIILFLWGFSQVLKKVNHIVTNQATKDKDKKNETNIFKTTKITEEMWPVFCPFLNSTPWPMHTGTKM